MSRENRPAATNGEQTWVDAPLFEFVVRTDGLAEDGKPLEFKAYGQTIPGVGSVLEMLNGTTRPVTAVHFRMTEAKSSATKPRAVVVVTVGPAVEK